MSLAYYGQLLGQSLTAGQSCTLSGVVEDVQNGSVQVLFSAASNASGTIQLFKNDDVQYATPTNPMGNVPAYRQQLIAQTNFGPFSTQSGFFTSMDPIDFRNLFATVNLNGGTATVDILLAGHSASKPT